MLHKVEKNGGAKCQFTEELDAMPEGACIHRPAYKKKLLVIWKLKWQNATTVM